jgi:phage host-nuclease inhibitor protein Gam
MATATKKIKQDAVKFPVPQTHDQVVEAIAEIGRRQRERDRIQADMNDELARIKERYEEEGKPHADAIRALSDGVHLYCEAHRDELTQGGKTKTANLSSGEIRWRMRPPSVVLKGIDKIIEALRAFGLARFIRTKEEIDKTAILAEPEAVKNVRGIRIVQDEDFVIVPFETSLEEVA